MAFNSYVGSFAQPASTGNQAITGLGFTPKIVFFFWTDKTADGSAAQTVFGYGVAVSSSSRAAFCSIADDNEASSDSFQDGINTECIRRDNTGSPPKADFVSMDADGFTITWDNVDATARVINYLALSRVWFR